MLAATYIVLHLCELLEKHLWRIFAVHELCEYAAPILFAKLAKKGDDLEVAL